MPGPAYLHGIYCANEAEAEAEADAEPDFGVVRTGSGACPFGSLSV